jgi:hypothetical protein
MRLKLMLIAALAVAVGFAMPVAVSVSTAQATTIDPTATAVSCQPGQLGSVTIGQAATCTAIVTDNSALGATTPTGIVSFTSDTSGGTFTDGGSCTLTAIGAPQASCSLSYIPGQLGPGGLQTITATYGGDNGHAVSSSQIQIAVALRATSMSLTCSPAAVAIGESVFCAVAVTDTSADATTPTGTVSFLEGTHKGNFIEIGSCTLTAAGIAQASCGLGFFPLSQLLGTQIIGADYSGDNGHAVASSEAQITVTLRATSTNVTCQKVLPVLSRCTATVTDMSPPIAIAPTGAVSFTSSGPGMFSAAQCTLSASATSALCTVTYATPAGVPFAGQIITVSYAGDAAHAGSTGSTALN